MRTITATLTAYATEYCSLTPQDYAEKAGQAIAERLSFARFGAVPKGWSVVGTAEVTITLPDADTLIANKVEALRAEKGKVMAEAGAAVTRIERQIQQLLAITHEVAA